MATNNISEVLARNGLTEDNVRSLAYVVEHGGIYPRVRRVLETVARLLAVTDRNGKRQSGDVTWGDDNPAKDEVQSLRDSRAILAEVLR